MDQKPKHHRSQSYNNGPVAHSTPSKSSVKSLRFSDVPVTIDDGGQDMPDGAAPPPLTTSLPPTRFVFKRELSGLNNNSNNSSAVNGLSEMERDTIIKQRTELQLLIGELRDRDKELNEMVQAHHTEMKAWEEDRTRSHTLEQRCAKLERDLNKRNNQIRELLKKMKSIENEAVETSSALNTTRHQLQTVIEQHTAVCHQLKDIEDYNNKLQQSYRDTSQVLGETEAKVTQLQHQLELKEKEAVATNKEVTDLASRLQSLEHSYKQLEKITFEVKNSANDWKNKYLEAKTTADSLKSELDIGNATMDEKDEELERLRRAINEKQDELSYTVEREKRKDQMLSLQKSKQERTDTELSTLRQMYDLQQHKLAATRKELTEIREKEIKQRTNFSQLPDESSMFDLTTGSLNSTPTRSPVKSSHSPPKRHISPQKSSQIHSCRPDGGDHSRDSIRDKSEVVTLDSHHQSVTSSTSTDRLQKLLSDSKKLVETITSNESKSPTHMIAQLSLSGGSLK